MSDTFKKTLETEIIEARNKLNFLLDQAAKSGIKLETRLISCHNVEAASKGISFHYLVEVLLKND